MSFSVKWIDSGREQQCQPDPDFPTGKHIDVLTPLGATTEVRVDSRDASPYRPDSCYCALPYPAARCGLYLVDCERCGVRVGVTTAGRPDDPKSIRIPCQLAEASKRAH